VHDLNALLCRLGGEIGQNDWKRTFVLDGTGTFGQAQGGGGGGSKGKEFIKGGSAKLGDYDRAFLMK